MALLADHLTTRLTEEGVPARVLDLIGAMAVHGYSVWSSTSAGRGGPGGQAITTTYHGPLLDRLVEGILRGETLEQVNDAWQVLYPGAASLLEAPRNGRMAGPDGRPR